MKKSFELLAPGGDINSVKAAIMAGADAVYCGLQKFNARNRATNIKFDELVNLLALAHRKSCKIYLTLNIIVLEQEIANLIKLLNKLVNTRIDGVIVQDLGLFYLLSRHFKTLKVHASTQVNTHNEGQIEFLKRLGVTRVNLARELNQSEIASLAQKARATEMQTEVFVYGSYCISFSGLCYFSSVHGGRSGNRGLCSQPCRDRFQQTQTGHDYPFNLKDNSTYLGLGDLADADVDALKIEGRMKPATYVYAVTSAWKEQLDRLAHDEEPLSDDTILRREFNRGFSDGYLKDAISVDMYIDNPRGDTINYFIKADNCSTEESIKRTIEEVDRYRRDAEAVLSGKIKELSKSQNQDLSSSGNRAKPIKPVALSPLNRASTEVSKTTLGLLISSRSDLELLKTTSASVHFRLPDAVGAKYSELVDLFLENPRLIPWFPAVLLGNNFASAVAFLKQVRPTEIVTANTGIAHVASEAGVQWIAGPEFNIMNSYSLKCLKDEFNCSGAFISNEINEYQIKRIASPSDFQLCYSIFHPILLQTSRQCLFFRTSGCEKRTFDTQCLNECEKAARITNMKGLSFIINKQKGCHNCLYSSSHYLNLDIVTDLPGTFSSYLIDLRDIETDTDRTEEKKSTVHLFENLLENRIGSASRIKEIVHPSTNAQYSKGL